MSATRKPRVSGWRRLIVGVPYLWMLAFFLLPFAIVLKISLAEALIAVPPYTSLFEWVQGKLEIGATLENYAFLFKDRLYALAYLNSLWIAALSTLICLLIGYPVAFAITRSSPAARSVLLMLVIIPSWTSFLIRVYAWIGILGNTGYLNNLLMSLGIVDEPLQMLRTNFAVYVGIVYTYLPFMILPLYANLAKLDYSLVEAALDLGAPPHRCFWSIMLPLTRNGIIAGSLLVFIPVTGEFVIPELLGGADTLMIGKVLWGEFFNNRDWPIASALAVLLLLVLIVPLGIYYRSQLPGQAGSAAGLVAGPAGPGARA